VGSDAERTGSQVSAFAALIELQVGPSPGVSREERID
jgi:hypothetical protein